MPDSFYIDPEKKDSSKFNEFKESVNELKLNKIYIITKLFEQLAILHANNFVVWNIKIWDKLITHPTLSLFLYRLKNKKWNINEEIFIHDIHNLKLLENPKSNDYINHCISDLKDLAFDIIRFFKWIWLPQWWFITYAKVLRQLNPELYSIVYRSFLWDPKIEIEIWALEKSMSENKKHQKTSSKVLSELETFKNDKIEVINSLFRKNDLFFLAKSKQKIIDFLNTINPDNTEIIIDFDNTITYPGSSNSLNVWFWENSEFNENINYDEFFLRMGSISFLKLLLMKWYKVKIYSLWLTEIISKVLELNWLSNKNIEIFANTKKDIKYSKKDIEIKKDDEKRKIIIWDDLVDFELVQSNNNSLKIWFLNENLKTKMAEKKLQFNWKTDFYFSNQKSNFDILYELFKQL